MVKSARPLRLLLVEDDVLDAELVLREVRRAGYDPDWKRVDSEKEYLHHLRPGLDLVLSDFAMPQFSGMRALELLKERQPETPFILVSGTIGEDVAVQAMRSGAADYLLKDRLTRLGQSISHVLEQQRARSERKQTQSALDQLRHHHQLILDSAGEGILGIDLKGNIVFENPKAAQLLGWEPSELLGRPIHETIHHTHSSGSAYPAESCPVLASLRDGKERRVSNDAFWRKNRTSFRVDLVAAPIHDEQKRVAGSIITFKDVTEQFVAQMRLKLQEQQYRLIFETNPNPMWVFDTKTFHILAVNDAAVAQYGYSRDEFLEMTLLDLRFPAEKAHLDEASSGDAIATHFSGEFRYRRKDGSSVLVEVYSGATVWTGVSARIVTAIDITGRRRAEERLREQADIIDRARDAIIIRDFNDRRITFWNRGAAQLYGWSAEEMVGTVGEVLFADRAQIETIMTALLATGEYRGEINQLAKDGTPVITDGRATLVRNPDGSPRSVLSITTDVTEKKKLEAQLLRAQRLESIGTLASGVAHDLNNILTPILICTETLRAGVSEQDLESVVSLIEGSARRGANVVKQVLTFARGIQGERVLINPSHLIEEMIDIGRSTFPKSIEISSRYSENLWSIESDPTQMHQVLLNLAVNARDAMPEGGSLVIGAENVHLDEKTVGDVPNAAPGDYIIFSVSDTGKGMPQSIVDKIFDPFFSTKEVGKGTGLGLSTSLGIVKSHGGFISLQSEQGHGTTFKVFLPAKVTKDTFLKTKAPEDLKGGRQLIMVVDDEPAILQVVKIILEKNNYRVLTANDAAEALAIFAKNADAIDAVLTDIMMPQMDGMALLRELKKMKPNVVVIASAGQGDEEYLDQLRHFGAADFLPKPYDSPELLEMIRKTLAKT